MTQYQNRDGKSHRAPSAGVVSRQVGGAGKLSPGRHDLEVLSVAEYPTHCVVILANAAGHAHAEPVADRPPPWFRVGVRVRASIQPGPGFVVVRDVDRYQGQDSATRAPITEWTQDLGELYAAATAAGSKPATTELREVTHGDDTWRPQLHLPPARPAAPSTTPTPNPAVRKP